MGQWKIPLSPENYYVWFVHIAGKNEELSRAIKKVTQSGGRFTPDLNQLLYHKYLGRRRDPVVWQQAQQEVQSILREILEELLSTSNAASKYGHSLADYARLLTDAEDLPQIQGLVKDLLRETRKMADSSSRLQKRLEKATQRAEDLKRQLSEAQKDAETDALTGLANRKAVNKKLSEVNEQFEADGVAFCVVMTDIDHFKKFNDTHGHQVGDAILKKVAATLNDNVKGMDLPGRYGGEEFILILPKTGLSDACRLAEKIRETMAKQRHKLANSEQEVGIVTLSFGVAQAKPGDTEESLVKRADAALYLAKDSGRNNVKSEQDLSSESVVV
jgi:diguanylate cyclase